MPIQMLCPTCNGKLAAPDHAAGKTVKCPKCQSLMVVPEAEPEFEVVDDGFEVVEDKPLMAKRPVRRKRDSDYDDEDDEVDEDDRPRPRKRRKRKEKVEHHGFFSAEKSIIGSGVIGGCITMLIAVVWFVVGLMNDWVFFYPPILFVVGLIAAIKGLAGSE